MNCSFDEMIVGHYLNKIQAFSDPSRWPQINILYSTLENNLLELKQWYDYKTEDDPYRHYHITYEYTNDTTVITQPINQETGNPSCILEWKYDGNWWTGSVKGECIINNARVESFIQFNGSLYRSLDTGYNVDTGDFVWGTEPGNGLFEFECVE